MGYLNPRLSQRPVLCVACGRAEAHAKTNLAPTGVLSPRGARYCDNCFSIMEARRNHGEDLRT